MATSNCTTCGRALATVNEPCPYCLLELGLTLPPPHLDSSGAPRAKRFTLPDPAELAELFPGLEVLELLGQGGMGAVYKVRQRKLDRLVALKVLPPETRGDPTFTRRFLREARAMALLSHENVVAVHDFGETAGVCWLLMEHVDGPNLRQLLERGELTPRDALRLVPPLCDALQHAHDLGIVHRDIKPENVLLARDGTPKIADFGLAKLALEPDANLTAPEQVMGTPHYMAPEQLRGSRDVDHRADIYSLGVVVYEMLTGALPVGRFQLPSRKADLDARIDEIVLRALEHEPAQRYQHAQEVKSELQGLGASAVSSTTSEAPRLGTSSVATPLAPTPRHASLRAISIPYACLWAVGFLALKMDVSTPLQAFLALLFVAAGTPYLAWRWWTGRGQRRGHALSYGLGAVLAASFATLAAPEATERLLIRLLPGESFDPSADPLFLRILAFAIAGASGALALRARRKIGVLSWKHFTNFAFDLLIVLAALAAMFYTIGFVVDLDTDRAGLLLAMPLFSVGFACDLVERRLQPRDRALASQPHRASSAKFDSPG
jgi:tRNA A-37 threonylcarbamoyl transferase component Bud32